jgi:acyl carrier protein
MGQLFQEVKKIVNRLQFKDIDSETLADYTLFFDGGMDLNSIDLLVLRQAIQVR